MNIFHWINLLLHVDYPIQRFNHEYIEIPISAWQWEEKKFLRSNSVFFLLKEKKNNQNKQKRDERWKANNVKWLTNISNFVCY